MRPPDPALMAQALLPHLGAFAYSGPPACLLYFFLSFFSSLIQLFKTQVLITLYS